MSFDVGKIYYDNQGAVALAKNLQAHAQSEHLNI